MAFFSVCHKFRLVNRISFPKKKTQLSSDKQNITEPEFALVRFFDDRECRQFFSQFDLHSRIHKMKKKRWFSNREKIQKQQLLI